MLNDYQNSDEFDISGEEVANFLQSIFAKTLRESMEGMKHMSIEEREKLEHSLENNYLAVSDPENYPTTSVRMFEGEAMVPARLVFERIQEEKKQKK